jgi:hypothetical protein
MDEQQTQLEDRPIGELMRQLSDQTTTLVRQEIELAKAEMTAKASSSAWARAPSAAPGSWGSTPSARSPPA